MRKFYLSSEDSYIGGVCGGLGEYTGIDAIFWRIGFLFTLKWTLPFYLIFWIFVKRK